jgi:hypothetical protein
MSVCPTDSRLLGPEKKEISITKFFAPRHQLATLRCKLFLQSHLLSVKTPDFAKWIPWRHLISSSNWKKTRYTSNAPRVRVKTSKKAGKGKALYR